jgi:uncharacterized protein (TIGR02246 family)
MQLIRQVTLFALLALACPPATAQVAGDEVAIRQLATRWEQAWNRHDMQQLASLMTEDADFVNVGARHWKGRGEIEAQHAARLDQFRESTWSTRAVNVQLLKPDVALAHIDWILKGDKDADGTPRPPRGGMFTWVVVKQGGSWLIRAAQNTNLGPNNPAQAATK